MNNSSQSSIDVSMSFVLPQHLISAGEATAMPPCSSTRRRGRTTSAAIAMAIPCLLLAASAPVSHALSLSSTLSAASSSRSLVDQARMIRELRGDQKESRRAHQRLSVYTKPLLDNDALSAALFGDDFNNSLESSVANLKRKQKSSSVRGRAEEFDRFMEEEEDATVASIVQENIKPESPLVDDVQQSKGADIVDMEVLLQQQAADRRRSREEAKTTMPSVKVTRKTKLASNSKLVSFKETKSTSALLTRDQEYALGHTISSAQSRAEEFDRFMEEDATVASIVQENIKPGSLVHDVQQSKGADILDMEVLLQQQAADRRRSREEAKTTMPSVKVTRKTKFASNSKLVSFKETKSPSALLTREQEYALARTIQSGTRVHKVKAEYESSHGSPLSKRLWAEIANMSSNDLRKLVSEYRTAKQELVSSNMGLVRAVVRNYLHKARYKGVSEEELIQEGSLGLIRAAELFDPEKGLRFSTYATIWIKGVLSNSNALDDVIALPSREKVLWNKVRRAWEEMAVEAGDDRSSTLGRNGKPSMSAAKDIAKRLGVKVSQVEQNLKRMNSASNVLSLDYQYTSSTRSGEADKSQEALMACSQFGTDADLAELAQFKADVVAALVRNLTERELTLMRLRYGLEDGKEYTVQDCAEKMGVSRETARQLQHACLKKLREARNMDSLQEYLLTVA